eukprot:m51a1_g5286 putative ubiquitin carboxyl-terminal hydrolase 5 isoform x2 (815) ;mRNA; f:193959-197068
MQFSAAELSGVRRPTAGSAVRKTECAYTFDTPESPAGLLVCLSCFLGAAPSHAPLHAAKSGHALYLGLRRTRRLRRPPPGEPPQKKRAPTVLGIGCEGGFGDPSDKYEWDERRTIVRVPSMESVELEHPCVPAAVRDAALDILAAESSEKKEDIAAWKAEQTVLVSKHAERLEQLDNGVRVPASGWQCQEPGCAFRENLWLNLGDGSVLCGRANFLGLGNEHAYKHYVATGRRFPLAVKLGTVTAEAADVYSYDEDEMVADPLLDAHLAHWGLDRAAMAKTDRTMAELALDVNQRYEFSRLTEADARLAPLFGAGHTGLRNLGNTCYLASVMQVLFSLDPFVQAYALPAQAILREAPADPTGSFVAQLAKLGDGLLSGRYGNPVQPVEGEEPPAEPYQEGIAPRAFKAVVARAHPAFNNKQQQDAVELFQAVLAEVDKAERARPGRGGDPSRLFQYRAEERLVCGASGRVRYSQRADNVVTLPIPVERASNVAEREPVRPVVPLAACVEALLAEETIEGFASPVGQRTTATKRTRMASFPQLLAVQMRRYVVGADYQPRKLDALVEMPDVLDLEALRAPGGPQDGELPLDDPAVAAPAPAAPAAQGSGSVAPDEAIVAQLVSMGFPASQCARAAVAAGNRNVDAAMDWLLSHMDDPEEPSAAAAAPAAAAQAAQAAQGAPAVAPEVVEMLCGMGFTEPQVRRALASTGGDAERAADWLLSHADAMDDAEPAAQAPAGAAGAAGAYVAPVFAGNTDPARYELVGFISHMGKTTQSGHYVAHIRKGDRWVLFNDEKVAVSEHPPRDMGYLYFYRRL